MKDWDAYVSFPPHDPGNVHLSIPTEPDTPHEEVERKTRFVAVRLMKGCARIYRKQRGTTPLSYFVAVFIEFLSWCLLALGEEANAA